MKSENTNKTKLKKLTITKLQPELLDKIIGGSSIPTDGSVIPGDRDSICYMQW